MYSLVAFKPPTSVRFRQPHSLDGAAVHSLVRRCPPLELNTLYCYLLLCTHFSASSTVAESAGKIVGFQAGYRKPEKPGTLFIWQICVAPEARGSGIAKGMVRHLLARNAACVPRFLEQSVARDNTSSRALFRSVANEIGSEMKESLLFGRRHFGSPEHGDEYLLRIGPIRSGGNFMSPQEGTEDIESRKVSGGTA